MTSFFEQVSTVQILLQYMTASKVVVGISVTFLLSNWKLG